MFGTRRRAGARNCSFLGPDEEALAIERAEAWLTEDPFPEVEPALLSAVEIRNYARVTGMIHPYEDTKLKAASYPAGMGGTFIRWQDGKKLEADISKLEEIILPPNSISYVQTDVTFRLPHYIAIRFNLQISHVHRGILLGTGPVVDPGFSGKLLIPLHNLTSTDYNIPVSEALIWIEFTKTTFGRTDPQAGFDASDWERFLFPERKKNMTLDQYFRRANSLNPIESSIPEAIKKMAQDAAQARLDASTAKTEAENARQAAVKTKEESDKADKRLTRIGFAGLVAVILAAIGIYLQAIGVIQDAAASVNGAKSVVDRAEASTTADFETQARVRDLETRLKELERRQLPPANATPPSLPAPKSE